MELIARGDDISMTQWLGDRVLPDYTKVASQVDELTTRILKAATGYQVETSTQLKYIQKNLLQLFGQLSSYTIKFLSEVNESSIIPLGWRAIRFGNISEMGHDRIANHNGVHILDVSAESYSSAYIKNAIEPTVGISAPVIGDSFRLGVSLQVNNSTKNKRDLMNYNTTLEATTPIITRQNKFDKKTDCIIDEYKIAELIADNSTSTNDNDDDLVLIDLVTLNNYTDSGVLPDCQHSIDGGYLVLINYDPAFDLLPLKVGDNFSITDGVNAGTYGICRSRIISN
jgi:hypothetical protein